MDKSLSMAYHLQPSVGSYISGIKTILEKLNNKGITFNTYSFGSKLDTTWNIKDQEIKDGSTNFGSVMDHIRSNNNKNVAGTLIITDGQANLGQEIPRDLNELNPIYIIGVGAKDALIDVLINSIDAPPVIIKGNKTEIEVEISAYGEINERMNVTLSLENKILGSKIFYSKGFGSIEKVRFLLNPTETGELKYQVQVNALPEEINILNNKQYITIQVLKNNYEIALITGAPNFNTNIIKTILKENNNYNIDHFVYLSNNYSKSLESFWETRYDLVIFDNHPIEENKNEWEKFLRIFAKKILAQQTSLAFFPGYDIDKNTFSSYLSLMNISLNEPIIELGKNLNWKINQNWRDSFPLQDKNLFLLNNMNKPPLFVDMEIDTLNLLTLASSFILDVEIPLLILKEKKPLRSLVFSSPDLNKIYFNSNIVSGKEMVRKMFNPLFSWLMKTGNGKDFYFRSNKNSYQQGEQITIVGQPVQELESLENGVINVFSEGQKINSKPIKYNKKTNSYIGSFWASQPGNLQYEIELLYENLPVIVSTGTVQVQESQIELNKVFLNRGPLETLSNKTNGKFILWDQRLEILTNITNEFRNDTINSIIYLHKKISIFLILILFLTLEWSFRRKLGLQ